MVKEPKESFFSILKFLFKWTCAVLLATSQLQRWPYLDMLILGAVLVEGLGGLGRRDKQKRFEGNFTLRNEVRLGQRL